MSDTGSYFKNLVVNELCQRQSIEQQFAVAYSPWISGIVERTNHDILMLMEFQLDKREWVYLLPLVQSNLNYTVEPSLNNNAPSELFTLMAVPNPLTSIVVPRPKKNLIPDVSAQRDNVDDLREGLPATHRDVVEMLAGGTRPGQQARSATSPRATSNFCRGPIAVWQTTSFLFDGSGLSK
ncbi:hypothetical protein PF011_g4075 [Phytophthora fragariae]|uniref:Integrase catalytic domain-containing protein n=1 Tax=Phytophthora fragariae TaxID=53985 RepID=A0A6A3LYH3_9STRA|nr:hypothetical protein PF011_g4075 [Phytophthora fragariae]